MVNATHSSNPLIKAERIDFAHILSVFKFQWGDV